MKISKKSWHARFYDHDLSKQTSLCDYVHVVVGNMSEYVLEQVGKLFLLLGFAYIIITSIQNPVFTLKIIAITLLIPLVVVVISFGLIFLELILGSEEPRPNTVGAKVRHTFRSPFVRVCSGIGSFTSVISEYFKAKKQNICPPIDFVE